MCDYALQGLPAAGTCPECGSAYDDRHLILRGYTRGDRSITMATRRGMIFTLVMFALVFVVQAFVLARAWRRGDFSAAAVPAAMSLLIVWLIAGAVWRRASLSGPPGQLWLCEEGYWLRDRTVARQGPVPGRRTWLAIIAISCAAGLAPAVYHAPLPGSLIATVFAATAYALWRWVKVPEPRMVERVVGAGGTVSFTAWEPTMRARVEPQWDGLHRVLLIPFVSPFWHLAMRRPIVFKTQLTDAQAAELRVKLSQWIQQASDAQRATATL